MATYLDLIADLASGNKVMYADLPKADRDHVRSLASDGFAETHAGNGRRVLKSHESAYVRLTAAGMAYAAALQAAGVIATPKPVPAPQPKTETLGRHAKPSGTKSSRKAGKVTTTKVAPKAIAPRQILNPQDLDALRRIAALLPSIDNFTDQFHK
jgi:hypothetical protein